MGVASNLLEIFGIPANKKKDRQDNTLVAMRAPRLDILAIMILYDRLSAQDRSASYQ